MNLDQIIQMAHDAGAMTGTGSIQFRNDDFSIERFAIAIRKATKEEDAKICDGISGNEPSGHDGRFGALDCAETIRASK